MTARSIVAPPLVTGALCAAVIISGCSSGRHSGGQARTSATSATSVTAPATSPAMSSSGSSATPPPPSASTSVSAGFEPASVTFVSATTGFVLGAGPCPAGTCTMLVATTNGGRSWSTVGSLSPAITGDPPAVTKVRFADARDGWAFGPQLWSTHDGGHNWHQINLPSGDAGAVIDLEASGGDAYALVGAHLLRTSVSSDSWSAVPGVSLASSPKSIALHGHAVWVVVSPGPGAGALVTSQDGAAWRTLPDPCASLGTEWVLAGAAPVSRSDVYLLCGGGAAAGSQAKKVLYSSDGGEHATPTAADPPFAGDVGDIAAASTAVIAVSARSGASWVYRSSDGGHTWRTALQQGDGGVGYFDLGFTTPTQGVAVYGQPGTGAHSRLLITRDAGASWAPVTF